MESIKIPEAAASAELDYDAEADVLYISIGAPRPGTGVDLGDGTILFYDEVEQEVVGLTMIGLRARLIEELATQS